MRVILHGHVRRGMTSPRLRHVVRHARIRHRCGGAVAQVMKCESGRKSSARRSRFQDSLTEAATKQALAVQGRSMSRDRYLHPQRPVDD